jgi:hypothetical protein
VISVSARSCLLKGLLVLRLAHRFTCLTNSQARSCLLKGLLVLQPSATHRFTYLANSRPGLAAQGITGLAALAHRFTYLANSRLGSLFGPIAKSTESRSRRHGFRCVSSLGNRCLRGLPLLPTWDCNVVS